METRFMLLRAVPATLLLATSLLITAAPYAKANTPTTTPSPAGTEIQYVEITPTFVTNYQSPKLRYIKADVTVVVTDTLAAEAIGRHQPLIRHHLIMLFSRQIEDTLATPEGRNQLKLDAMQEIVRVLESEQESTAVKDLLFTGFNIE
jgi:flagellar FliL protein